MAICLVTGKYNIFPFVLETLLEYVFIRILKILNTSPGYGGPLTYDENNSDGKGATFSFSLQLTKEQQQLKNI